jgi:hypothetical protein
MFITWSQHIRAADFLHDSLGYLIVALGKVDSHDLEGSLAPFNRSFDGLEVVNERWLLPLQGSYAET